MKARLIVIVLISSMLLCGMGNSGIRTYRQVKDVAARENGTVQESQNKANLFEYTYKIDLEKKIITRISIRRLDEEGTHPDATVYTLMKKQRILGSEMGNGGDVFIAIQKNGTEIIELGQRYALTARFSPFSQVITGVYKRTHHRSR